MKTRRWTDEQLKTACKVSNSVADVIRELGLIPAGGNYRSIKQHVKRLNIDTSHFAGQLWSKGKILGPQKDLAEYLVFGYTQSDRLRKRLLAENVKEHKCESCLNTEWLGEPIPLELDHIDGVHENNCIENLRLLCPNCHAKTETYRGKNTAKHRASVVQLVGDSSLKRNTVRVRISSEVLCKQEECHKVVSRKAKFCTVHYVQPKKINWPSQEELLLRLENSSYSALGKELGVSDNAIRKHLKQNMC